MADKQKSDAAGEVFRQFAWHLAGTLATATAGARGAAAASKSGRGTGAAKADERG